MQNLSIVINSSTNFEQEVDSLTTSMSSSFSSSGCVTPASTSSYMSRRPSRDSEGAFLHYMSGTPSLNSASPTTPVDMNSFSVDPSSVDPGRFALASFFEDYPMSHGIIDHDVPVLSLADPALKPPQAYWDTLGYASAYVMDANEMCNAGMGNLFQSLPAQTMISQPAEENQWSLEPVYDTCVQSINQGTRRWVSMNSQQHAQTIVPSQTLVEQPTTPLIKPEPLELQSEASELSNSMQGLDLQTYQSALISSTLPALSPSSKLRAKKTPSTSAGRTSKSSPGIVKLAGFQYFTSRRSGRALPYNKIAERRRVLDNAEKPNGYPCGLRKADGEICDKSFKRKEHLTRHTKTHTGEQTRKCPFCEKKIQAAREDNMKTHIEKTHIKESPSGRNSRYWEHPVTKKKERITYELMRRLDTEMASRWKVKK
ncbi:hypothetical protein MMC30_009206 [Trapelia coarctata]|nr:hypothetical protein [Trapelia coarctata]